MKVPSTFDQFERWAIRTINPIRVPPLRPETPNFKFRDDWYSRAKVTVKEFDDRLERALPNFFWQTRLDNFGRMIDDKLDGLRRINRLIDLPSSASDGPVKFFLLTIIRLPLKIARNLIVMVFDLLETIVKFAVHPAKQTLKLAEFFIDLLKAFTNPYTLTQLGLGILGSSMGQSIVSGNPISLIGVAVGSLLAAVGAGWLLFSSRDHLSGIVQSEEMMKTLEAFLTGFVIGMIAGGIQNAIKNASMKNFKVTSLDEAKAYADSFIQKHNLPNYTSLTLENGKVIISWAGQDTLLALSEANNDILNFQYFNPIKNGVFEMPLECQVVFAPHAEPIHILKLHGFEGYSFQLQGPLEGFPGYTYPTPPSPAIFDGVPALGAFAKR